jgi:hypothetical protein
MARAPAVAWSWRESPPLAMFFRRGANGDDPSRARREVGDLLLDLRRNPCSDKELAAARQALAAETAGFTAGGDRGAVVPGRALSTVLAARRGFAELAWDGVSKEQVSQALGVVLAESQMAWLELVAVPKPGSR